jgi:two-component system response regulator PilR (NtrC family)
MGRKSMRIGEDALALIASYPFPGNVRELMNAVERALILADGELLSAADFQLGNAVSRPPRAPDAPEAPSLAAAGERGAADSPGSGEGEAARGENEILSLAEIEKRAILASLRRNGGKREKTAAELGITRRTLFSKLADYGYKD